MRLIASIILGFLCLTGNSQEISNQLFCTAGQSSKTKNLQLDWSIGEIAISTQYAPGAIYTEGFHQPSVIIVNNIALAGSTSSPILDIWPNPTQNYISVKYSGQEDKELSFQLFDFRGKPIKNIEIFSRLSNFTLNISHLMPGVYFLRVCDVKGILLDYQKVIKTL